MSLQSLPQDTLEYLARRFLPLQSVGMLLRVNSELRAHVLSLPRFWQDLLLGPHVGSAVFAYGHTGVVSFCPSKFLNWLSQQSGLASKVHSLACERPNFGLTARLVLTLLRAFPNLKRLSIRGALVTYGSSNGFTLTLTDQPVPSAAELASTEPLAPKLCQVNLSECHVSLPVIRSIARCTNVEWLSMGGSVLMQSDTQAAFGFGNGGVGQPASIDVDLSPLKALKVLDIASVEYPASRQGAPGGLFGGGNQLQHSMHGSKVILPHVLDKLYAQGVPADVLFMGDANTPYLSAPLNHMDVWDWNQMENDALMAMDPEEMTSVNAIQPQLQCTLLCAAVLHNNVDAVRKLVEECGADPNASSFMATIRTEWDMRKPHGSVSPTSPWVVECPRVRTAAGGGWGIPGLHAFCRSNSRLQPFLSSRTALGVAIAARRRDLLVYLLRKGASPRMVDGSFATAFELACRVGDISIVQTLLDYGVQVSPSRIVRNSYVSPLYLTLVPGDDDERIQIAEMLISMGADPNEPVGMVASTSVIASVLNGEPLDVKQCLLPTTFPTFAGPEAQLDEDNAALVNTTTVKSSLLAVCVALMRKKAVDFLLRVGARAEACPMFVHVALAGLIAGMPSVRQGNGGWGGGNPGHAEDVQYLERAQPTLQWLFLESGAPLHVLNEKGQTPLLVASCFGMTSIVSAILASPQGASLVNVPDLDGNVPLTFALAAGANGYNMVRELLQAGAKLSVEEAGRSTLLGYRARLLSTLASVEAQAQALFAEGKKGVAFEQPEPQAGLAASNPMQFQGFAGFGSSHGTHRAVITMSDHVHQHLLTPLADLLDGEHAEEHALQRLRCVWDASQEVHGSLLVQLCKEYPVVSRLLDVLTHGRRCSLAEPLNKLEATPLAPVLERATWLTDVVLSCVKLTAWTSDAPASDAAQTHSSVASVVLRMVLTIDRVAGGGLFGGGAAAAPVVPGLRDATLDTLLSSPSVAPTVATLKDQASGFTLLHACAVTWKAALIRQLCASPFPIDVNARDADGNTPLHLALSLPQLAFADIQSRFQVLQSAGSIHHLNQAFVPNDDEQLSVVPTFQALLAAGADPFLANKNGHTAVHLLAQRCSHGRYVSLLESLDATFEQLDAPDIHGCTPLWWAVAKPCPLAVTWLLGVVGCDFTRVGFANYSPVALSLWRGCSLGASVMDGNMAHLIASALDFPMNASSDGHGNLVLMPQNATVSQPRGMGVVQLQPYNSQLPMQEYLEAASEETWASWRDCEGRTLLWLWCRSCSQMATLSSDKLALIREKLSPEQLQHQLQQRDAAEGYTPLDALLHCHNNSDYKECITSLLDMGATLRGHDATGMPTLFRVAKSTMFQSIYFNAKFNDKVDLSVVHGTTGDTLLHFVLDVRHANNFTYRVVDDLLKAGVDQSRCNRRGWTPLLQAAMLGQSAIIQTLLWENRGTWKRRPNAPVNHATSGGHTALHFAAMANSSTEHRLYCMAMLVAAGASLTAVDHNGNTALQLAAPSVSRNDLRELVVRLRQRLAVPCGDVTQVEANVPSAQGVFVQQQTFNFSTPSRCAYLNTVQSGWPMLMPDAVRARDFRIRCGVRSVAQNVRQQSQNAMWYGSQDVPDVVEQQSPLGNAANQPTASLLVPLVSMFQAFASVLAPFRRLDEPDSVSNLITQHGGGLFGNQAVNSGFAWGSSSDPVDHAVPTGGPAPSLPGAFGRPSPSTMTFNGGMSSGISFGGDTFGGRGGATVSFNGGGGAAVPFGGGGGSTFGGAATALGDGGGGEFKGGDTFTFGGGGGGGGKGIGKGKGGVTFGGAATTLGGGGGDTFNGGVTFGFGDGGGGGVGGPDPNALAGHNESPPSEPSDASWHPPADAACEVITLTAPADTGAQWNPTLQAPGPNPFAPPAAASSASAAPSPFTPAPAAFEGVTASRDTNAFAPSPGATGDDPWAAKEGSKE